MSAAAAEMATHLPDTCCSNVGGATFRSCGAAAEFWYQHGDDVCSFCREHNCPCGEPINQQREADPMSDIAAEMERRQKLADDREADPTLADLWAGSTTQPDIDSHQFPFEEGCGVFCGGDCESEWCNCCGDCCDCMPIDDAQPRCTGLGCPGGCDKD